MLKTGIATDAIVFVQLMAGKNNEENTNTLSFFRIGLRFKKFQIHFFLILYVKSY